MHGGRIIFNIVFLTFEELLIYRTFVKAIISLYAPPPVSPTVSLLYHDGSNTPGLCFLTVTEYMGYVTYNRRKFICGTGD